MVNPYEPPREVNERAQKLRKPFHWGWHTLFGAIVAAIIVYHSLTTIIGIIN